jgi:hypothetical protein
MRVSEIRIRPEAAARRDWSAVTFLDEDGGSVLVRFYSEDIAGDEAAIVARAKEMMRDASLSEIAGPRGVPLSADAAAGLPSAAGEHIEEEMSLDEESDNPYQEPDEALPDDDEEREILRNPEHARGRFGDS